MEQPQILQRAYAAANSVNVQEVIALGLKGDAIAQELEQRRIKVMKQALRQEENDDDPVDVV